MCLAIVGDVRLQLYFTHIFFTTCETPLNGVTMFRSDFGRDGIGLADIFDQDPGDLVGRGDHIVTAHAGLAIHPVRLEASTA